MRINRSALQIKLKQGLFIVGKNSILEVLNIQSDNIDLIIFSDKYNSPKIKKIEEIANAKRIPILKDSSILKIFEDRSGLSNDGVIAIFKKRINFTFPLKQVLTLCSEVDNVTSVAFSDIDYEQNLGSMIRSCAGLGVDFILSGNGQQKMFTPLTTKTAMGYNYTVPIVQDNFISSIDVLKDSGFEIIGLDMGGENIQNMSYNPRVCFLVGNEASGLSGTMMKRCNRVASIPMCSGVESLNVSVSLAVALYDRNIKNEIKR